MVLRCIEKENEMIKLDVCLEYNIAHTRGLGFDDKYKYCLYINNDFVISNRQYSSIKSAKKAAKRIIENLGFVPKEKEGYQFYTVK